MRLQNYKDDWNTDKKSHEIKKVVMLLLKNAGQFSNIHHIKNS